MTFALNYAVGGLSPVGYHAANAAIHVLAGLALFGVVRRTLALPRLAARYGGHAPALAFAAALLWLVHPLQTQAVTYVAQRCESLMGLLLLATLYAFLRAATGPRTGAWGAAAVAACALGMGAKEVMVVAPVLVLLYDRTFLSGSFAAALRRHRGLHAGVAATWLVPLVLIGPETIFRGEMARPELPTPGVLEYALTQPGVLLHYLRMAFWPSPLCFDYGWPVAQGIGEIAPPLLAVGAIGGLVLFALWRNAPLGFVGAWFFVILAPTSSLQPTHAPAVEHRMYLSLASVVLLAVLAAHHALARLGAPKAVAPALLAAVAAALGAATVDRNRDYENELVLWRTVLEAAPENPAGPYTVGTLLQSRGRFDEALLHLRHAVALDPDSADAQNNLANLLLRGGDLGSAIIHYRAALAADPEHQRARVNLGFALYRAAEAAAAITELRQALLGNPRSAKAHYGLALALEARGARDEAMHHYRQALTRPHFADAHRAHNNLGRAHQARGELVQAEHHYRESLRLRPERAISHNNLATVLHAQGRLEDALASYARAIELEPGYAKAHNNLGAALEELGRLDDAIERYRRALALDPGYASARENLENALARRGDAP